MVIVAESLEIFPISSTESGFPNSRDRICQGNKAPRAPTRHLEPHKVLCQSLRLPTGRMATSNARKRTLRTACDRCYELKERCVRAGINDVCRRCNRLDLTCSTVRPQRPAGRRPRHRKQSDSGIGSSSSSTVDVATWLQEAPDLDLLPVERELLIFLLSQPERLAYYTVSPRFQAAEQRSLAAPLPAALPVLKDAYLACAGALKRLESGSTAEDQSASLRHASSAMGILRSFLVANSEDAALCLTLGARLALFAYSAVGVGVADICRYCLSITNPFIEDLLSDADPDSEPRQSFLVLMETMDCLVHRRQPTLRIRPRVENVDRHLGLSLPLLPYYHDLCVINYSLANNTDASYLARLQKELVDIEGAVERWQPFHPHLVKEFESAEVVNLLAQAKVYRLGGLLLSHRLRHEFGQKDGQAEIWAKEVLMELDLAQKITKQPIRCVTMPFLVAAIEIRGPQARIKALQDVDKYVDQFAPLVQKAAKTFLSRVWRERDLKITTCWFDSAHKPCVVWHYVDTVSSLEG